MRRSRNGIELMQVVGQYARIEQSFGQTGKRVHAVVDSAQQYRLIQQCRARVSEPRHCRIDVIVDFIRVIRMHDDGDRPRQSRHPGDQFIVHAFRQDDRQTRVHAEAADVLDG